MKNKSRLLKFLSGALTALIIGTSTVDVSAQPFPQNCATNMIDISTGANHPMSTMYPYSTATSTVRDRFWNVTCAPSNSCGIQPTFCAYMVQDADANTWAAFGGTTGTGRWISFTPNPTPDACSDFFWQSIWDNDKQEWNPSPGATPIRFTRDFYLMNAGTVNIVINQSFADDQARIAVDAVPCNAINGGPNVVYQDPAVSNTPGGSIPGTTLTLVLGAGPHTLDVDLYDISGTLAGINISGFISVPGNSTARLVSNDCYGIHSCSSGCYNRDSSFMDVASVSAASPCSFTAHAHVTTTNTILGYSWTVAPAGIGPVTHATTAADDYYPFTIAAGSVATVTCTVHMLDEDGKCCEAVFTQEVTCQGCGCFEFARITTDGGETDGNDCEFKLIAETYMLGGCTMESFEWFLGSSPSVINYSTAFTDYNTISVPYGTTETVTVIFHAVLPDGTKCDLTKTIYVHCGRIGPDPTDPNGHKAGRNDGKATGKLMNTLKASDITIYPNPTDNIVTVSSANEAIKTVQVVDVNGKVVAEYAFDNSKKETVSLNKLAPGTYLIRVNGTVTKTISRVHSVK